jgi:surface antigen
MLMKSFKQCALFISLFAVVSVASATQSAFVHTNITSKIPARDLSDFKNKVNDVLVSTPDQQEAIWHSQHSASSPQISVSFKPLATVETKSLQTCRLLNTQIRQPTRAAKSQSWYCKQNDGQWTSRLMPATHAN